MAQNKYASHLKYREFIQGTAAMELGMRSQEQSDTVSDSLTASFYLRSKFLQSSSNRNLKLGNLSNVLLIESEHSILKCSSGNKFRKRLLTANNERWHSIFIHPLDDYTQLDTPTIQFSPAALTLLFLLTQLVFTSFLRLNYRVNSVKIVELII